MNLTCTFRLEASSTERIETHPVPDYIPRAMRTVAALLLLLLAVPSSGRAQTEGTAFPLVFLRDLDNEVAGLLDAYLEAVPECPARADTPIRLWVLDVAWLRADGARSTAMALDTREFGPDFPAPEWEAYLLASGALLDVFGSIAEAYHSDSVPGEMLCIGLETDLLLADSLWRAAELTLFERLAEEGYHE